MSAIRGRQLFFRDTVFSQAAFWATLGLAVGVANLRAQAPADGPTKPAEGLAADPATDVTITPDAVVVPGRLSIDVKGTAWQWEQIPADELPGMTIEDIAPPPGAEATAPDSPPSDDPESTPPAPSSAENDDVPRAPVTPPRPAWKPSPDVRLVGRLLEKDAIAQVLVTDRPVARPETRSLLVNQEIERETGPLTELGVRDLSIVRPKMPLAADLARWSATFIGPDDRTYSLTGAVLFGRPSIHVVIVSGTPADAVEVASVVSKMRRIDREGTESPLPPAATLFPAAAMPGTDGAGLMASLPASPFPDAVVSPDGLTIDGVVSLGEPAGDGEWKLLTARTPGDPPSYQWGDPAGTHVMLEIRSDVLTTNEQRRPLLFSLIRPKLELLSELSLAGGTLRAPRPTDEISTVAACELTITDRGGVGVVSTAVAVFGRRGTYLFEAIGTKPDEIQALLSVVGSLKEIPPPVNPSSEKPHETATPDKTPVFVLDEIAGPIVAAVGRLDLPGVAAITPPESGGVWRLQADSKLLEQRRTIYRHDDPTKPLRVYLLSIDRTVSANDERRDFLTAERDWMTDQLTKAGYQDVKITVEIPDGDVPDRVTFRQTAKIVDQDRPYQAQGIIAFGNRIVIAEVNGLEADVPVIADQVLASLTISAGGAAPEAPAGATPPAEPNSAEPSPAELPPVEPPSADSSDSDG